MSPLDRMRIARVVAGYDFWLEARGVPGRRRRDLRRELRSNITEAVRDVGVRPALAGVGSARLLAQEATSDGVKRPLWSLAAACSAAVLVLLAFAAMLAGSGFVDAVEASGVRQEVAAPLSLLPGVSGYAHFPEDGGTAFGISFGWQFLLPALVVFVVVARPWRLLRTSKVTAGAGRAPRDR
ncbi:MAG TPA: hypothetical protein VFX33_13815 [Actinomycetales bacterium]|nr:hypothetical protein [Actinomycetales bacterium]